MTDFFTEDDTYETTQLCCHYFTSLYNYGITRERLRCLIYMAECAYFERFGERVTNLQWKKYMFGPRDEELTNKLLDEWRTETRLRAVESSYHKRTHVKTYTRVRRPHGITDNDRLFDICTELYQETKDKSLNDVMSRHRNSERLINADGGEPLVWQSNS